MTPEQEVQRLRDIIGWVQENAHDIATRRFVHARLRELDDDKEVDAARAALPAGRPE
jgi:hypothetical protein